MSKQPKVRLEATGKNIFVFVDGVRVAKRGHPGAPQAGTRGPRWSRATRFSPTPTSAS